jgi:competence ComEA-like helix-hairpin-helix protein
MAIIPLRQYNREIEGMIDTGQVDEAIAHCRHILQTYPKHIQTYRLLGKTFLESQRYTDASDIFQRLLAVVPDDFVSHVGMSIIREDENNLDAAIWHMERAFETQPSNGAIQEELRRLYGRRDGIEPPKIRLTRGALARMYARGNLYEQAISELRSALSEDPQRVDLLVLLAQMYYHIGQRVEAIDVCNNIVKKYSFCLEALRLLVATLPETNRAQDAEEYRQRLISLDPYYTNAAPKALTADDVPETAVTIERLTYRVGQSTAGAPEQPAWASSLGVAFEKESSEQLPEWLQEDESPALASGEERAPVEAAPFSWEASEEKSEETHEAPAEEEAIPDWMKEAGWQPSTGQAVESPIIFDQEETEGEIVKGDIPDWLKDMAPEGALDEELPPLAEDDSEAVLPWLQEKQPEPTDTIDSWMKEARSEEQPEAVIEPPASAPETEFPDWLHEDSISQPAEAFAEEPQLSDEEQLPSWIADLEQAKDKPSGITDWLRSSALPPEPPATSEPTSDDAVSSTPPDLADQDAALAWLENLAAQHGAKEEELITKPEERLETPPDWVQPAETRSAVPGLEEPVTPPPQQIDEGAETPDWLKDLAPVDEVPSTPTLESVEPIESVEETELPDWIREMAPTEEIAPSNEVPAHLEPAEEAGLPDWLRSMASTEEIEPVAASEIPASSEEVEKVELPDWLLSMAPEETEPSIADEITEKFEAAEGVGLPDWLSELETKEGTPEESAEQTLAFDQETPTWLQEIASEETLPEPVDETPIESIPTDEVPAWLQEMTVEETAPEPASEAAVEPISAEEISDWLHEMTSEEATSELVSGVPDESAATEVVPDWLRDMAPEETLQPSGEAPLEPVPAEEIPSWVQAMETAAPETTAPSEPAAVPGLPDLNDQDAALAWLESLAVQHGAKEDELITRPEERLDTPPDWVQGSVVSEEITQEITPELAPEEAELPAWIAETDLTAPGAVEAFESINEEEAISPEEPIAHAEELPSWLLEMAPEEIASEPIVEATGEATSTEEIPAWLQEMASEEAAPEPVAETPIESAPIGELPTWLHEMAPEETAPESAVEMPTEPVQAEDIPAWLEEVSKESSAPEPVVEPAPAEEVPSWLQETPIEEAAQESVAEITIEPAEEIPAWLQEEITKPPLELIDLNTASLNQLERLPGVGFVLAQQIVTQREARGGFKNLDELSDIPGFSSDLVDSIRNLVTVPVHAVEPVLTFAEDDEAILAEARQNMGAGQSADATTKYAQMIKKNYRLETIIHELQDALYRYPVDVGVWQTLGDAYMRNDNLQEALDAYTKAEELLR